MRAFFPINMFLVIFLIIAVAAIAESPPRASTPDGLAVDNSNAVTLEVRGVVLFVEVSQPTYMVALHPVDVPTLICVSGEQSTEAIPPKGADVGEVSAWVTATGGFSWEAFAITTPGTDFCRSEGSSLS